MGKHYLTGEQISNLVKKHNLKKRKNSLGIMLRPKGRPRTRNLTEKQKLELENKKLKCENDLLRSFLIAAGRM